jgi:hypothetical protein
MVAQPSPVFIADFCKQFWGPENVLGRRILGWGLRLRRCKQIHHHGILECFDRVRRIRWNFQHVSGRYDALFAGDRETELPSLDHADLLVGVLMQSGHGAFQQPAPYDAHGLAVDHLP